MADEANILINAYGTYADASPSALRLLGVGLREFLSMAPGSFSPEPRDPEADRAFRAAWEDSGSPDLGGEVTILRGDGSKARVRFMIMPQVDGRYLAMIEPTDGEVERPATVYTLGEVLAQWRAAERRLDELEVGGTEWLALQSDVSSLRERYQRLFAAKQAPARTFN
ncbi:MAG: PAS domain-containing protein [Chloroflexota bacterium]|nr:PAS domain-containing protein [Chloroflexota bacterium]